VWALRDIDFKVEQGDVVGIIGKNGAGKSTLLKLLSRVTGPTTGTIRAHGRIGSLLEVGTGFHGEMTGRENIFMNGAILGMSRSEIQSKLDEIIDFSGCERYIDTPVKRYSSGMTVRLGFAVAAFLEPEILVVDEVLAVGDAEFQKKAIGKMKDVSQGQGRTVLFVSHNMTSVRQLCKHCILLKNGMIEKRGDTGDVVDYYLASQAMNKDYERRGNGMVRVEEFVVEKENVSLGDDLRVEMRLKAYVDVPRVDVSIDVKDENFSQIAHVSNYDNQFHVLDMKAGEERKIQCLMKNINLAPGSYSGSIWVGDPYNMYDAVVGGINFNVLQNAHFIQRETVYDSTAKVVIPSLWQYDK
jgi:lipopolysaccharide transport system ATP-binding protein